MPSIKDIFDGNGWITVFMPDNAPPVCRQVVAPPTLREAQDIVGGFIELVCDVEQRCDIFTSAPRSVPMQLYVNEEGRINNLPVNRQGTFWLARRVPQWDHWLVGPVLILTGKNGVML